MSQRKTQNNVLAGLAVASGPKGHRPPVANKIRLDTQNWTFNGQPRRGTVYEKIAGLSTRRGHRQPTKKRAQLPSGCPPLPCSAAIAAERDCRKTCAVLDASPDQCRLITWSRSGPAGRREAAARPRAWTCRCSLPCGSHQACRPLRGRTSRPCPWRLRGLCAQSCECNPP